MRRTPAAILVLLISACSTVADASPSGSTVPSAPASSGPDWSALPTLDVAITDVLPFPTGFPALLGVAPVAYGSWWVANGAEGEPPRVRRLDPATLEVTDVIEIDGEPNVFPPDADGVAVSANGIWVPLAYQEAMVLVDPATNRIVRRIEVDANPYRLLEDGDKLWISDFENSEVLRLDLATGQEELRVSVPSVTEMRLGPEGFWVVEHDGFVTRLDPATGEQLARLEVGGRPGVTLGLGSVWAGSDDEKTLSRIDPTTNELVAKMDLPSNGRDAVIADGWVWMAVSPQRGDCERTSYLVRIDPELNAVDGLLQVPCVAFVAAEGERLRVSMSQGGVLSVGTLSTSP